MLQPRITNQDLLSGAATRQQQIKRNTTIFDLQPTLKSDLIEVRPLSVDDFDPLFAVAADPLLWEQHPARDRYQPDVFRQFFAIALDSCGALTVIDNASGTIIGSSRYHGYDESGSVIEIGWTYLARSCWGGSYNSDLKDLMISHAFQYVRQILFMSGVTNYRSQRAVEKLGAIRQLTPRRDSSGNESYVYILTAADYHRY